MKISSIVLAAALSTVNLAWADHTDNHENANNSQQLSRRAYSAPVAQGDSAPKVPNVQAEKNYKTLQLHMLGKRPYAEKSTNQAGTNTECCPK